MTFRKDSLMFYEYLIGYGLAVIFCLAITPIDQFGVSPILAIPFIVLILVNPKLHNEFITINEIGISCHKSGKQIWVYRWNNIANLQRSSRYRMPSIEIVVYSSQEQGQSQLSGCYFQLSKTAKKALKLYYKSEVIY